MSTEQEQLIEKVKEMIDPLFDNEEGVTLLEELAEFIQTNNNN